MPAKLVLPNGLRKVGISTATDNLAVDETLCVEVSDLARLFGLQLMARLAADDESSKKKGNQNE
ncbi:hypothetical protein DTO96_102545 [Ephemeroptericola cinctiostellae]|uniref:Uncharacterized protein n=1 Tax=Ephemeroptericola cinctiostellae TaxID=2268024 RepID=A0A345DEK1_9BURK|nr:hypothetical protein [Ephemeroptericola cinctiostellae]AXF86789.1 hypothetical protein DTO96_102545 [Ephemeroptericola cinctiostellae]